MLRLIGGHAFNKVSSIGMSLIHAHYVSSVFVCYKSHPLLPPGFNHTNVIPPSFQVDTKSTSTQGILLPVANQFKIRITSLPPSVHGGSLYFQNIFGFLFIQNILKMPKYNNTKYLKTIVLQIGEKKICLSIKVPNFQKM